MVKEEREERKEDRRRKRRSRGINHERRKLKRPRLTLASCHHRLVVSPFFLPLSSFSPLLFFSSDLSSGMPGSRAFSEAWRGRDK